MQPSSPAPYTDQARSPSPTKLARERKLLAAGVAGIAVCCLGVTLLLAGGGAALASILLGPWGAVLALAAGLTVWGAWRHRRLRACDLDPEPITEETYRG